MIDWPLTGRDDELAALHDALATHERSGALIVGESGVGKSRLLQEVADSAADVVVERIFASASVSGLLFGAVSDLLPAAPASDRSGLLAQLRSDLAERADGRRTLLAVDDAHWLDEGTLSLVHQLASAHEAFVVATVRSDLPIPETVTSLWKDGHLARLDVRPLDRVRCGSLVRTVLGHDVSSVVADELFNESAGHPLYLRILVETGVETGDLRVDDAGVWTYERHAGSSPALDELVMNRISQLPRHRRETVEMVALSEPLPVRIARRTAPSGMVDDLVAEGVLRIDRTAEQFLVRTPHPLHAQVVVEHLGDHGRRTVARRLMESWSDDPSPDAVLQAARWALEAEVPVSADLNAEAAQRALSRFDHDLASRLGRAATEQHSLHPIGNLVLAETYRRRREGDAAAEHLERAAAGATDDTTRAQIAIVHAETEFLLRKDQDQALRVLERASKAVGDEEARRVLAVETAFLGAVAGRLSSVVEVAEQALAPGGTPETELEVLNALVFAQALSMQLEGIEERCARGIELALRHQRERPLAQHQIGLARVLGRIGRCRPSEAFSLAEDGLASSRGSGAPTGIWGTVAAFAGCFTGDLDAAADAGIEAVNSLLENDPFGTIGMAARIGCVAALQAGRTDDAHWIVERQGPPSWGTDPRTRAALAGRVEAWETATSGDLLAAARISTSVGNDTIEDGQHLWAAASLNDAVRFGGHRDLPEAARALQEAADGPLVRSIVEHADALAAGDVESLTRRADQWGADGFTLSAVDADAQASAISAARNDPVPACRSATRALVRWRGCTGSPTPSLRVAGPGLSARVLDTVCAAVEGASSREIAERSFVSPRTVEGRLQTAYRLLGVSGRDELRAVLGSVVGLVAASEP